MSQSTERHVEHDIVISAPAADIYRLIADVASWPRIFPPTIYVDHVEKGERDERIHIWAVANGEPKDWTSRRVLDPDNRRIGFRQEVSSAPVAAMGGTWIVESLSDSESRVRLLHDYRAVDGDADALAWIDRAVDGNSRAELAALKTNIELAHRAEGLAFAFQDSVSVHGSAKDVFDFINDAQLWSSRLPHVASIRLDETRPGLQTLEMETRAQDGSTHVTKSYRVAFPHRKIAYKQVTLPALMSVHTGYWTVAETADAVVATSQHAVLLNTENIGRVLGAEATVADARDYVRGALSANSTATLGHAKAYAESMR
ncbi:MAG TPA: aromatase/cyclase [Pseudonocardiaceae bacterium]|nr:aromatase/cyclase [Pseudonocardiaceae bacterium]